MKLVSNNNINQAVQMLENEGWSWVEIQSYNSAFFCLDRIAHKFKELSKEQCERILNIHARLKAINDNLEWNDLDCDQEYFEACENDKSELIKSLAKIHDQTVIWLSSDKAVSGAVVYQDSSGNVRIMRGLIKSEIQQDGIQIENCIHCEDDRGYYDCLFYVAFSRSVY